MKRDYICTPSTSSFLSSSDPVHRLSGRISDHSLISNTPGKKGYSKMRKCIVCSKKNKIKRSSDRCKQCNVVLCKTRFEKYHNQKNYGIILLNILIMIINIVVKDLTIGQHGRESFKNKFPLQTFEFME